MTSCKRMRFEMNVDATGEEIDPRDLRNYVILTKLWWKRPAPLVNRSLAGFVTLLNLQILVLEGLDDAVDEAQTPPLSICVGLDGLARFPSLVAIELRDLKMKDMPASFRNRGDIPTGMRPSPCGLWTLNGEQIFAGFPVLRMMNFIRTVVQHDSGDRPLWSGAYIQPTGERGENSFRRSSRVSIIGDGGGSDVVFFDAEPLDRDGKKSCATWGTRKHRQAAEDMHKRIQTIADR